MVKKNNNFSIKRKKEFYYKEAKKIEVRARSYFKLEQIDKKFNLIKNNFKILDLGCAPGGWLQYMDKKITNGEIIGIDLLEVKKKNEFSNKVNIIEDDFNNLDEHILKLIRNNNNNKIKDNINNNHKYDEIEINLNFKENNSNLEYFDLIVSDMAPEFSGNSTLDRGRTHKLNFETIKLAKKYLKKDGNLIFKSFEGEDLRNVRDLAKNNFKKIIEFKPKSSQKKSAEIFEICLNKK